MKTNRFYIKQSFASWQLSQKVLETQAKIEHGIKEDNYPTGSIDRPVSIVYFPTEDFLAHRYERVNETFSKGDNGTVSGMVGFVVCQLIDGEWKYNTGEENTQLFVDAYTDAVEFTLDDEIEDDRGFSADMWAQIKIDCMLFLMACDYHNGQNPFTDGFEHAAHDYWLTRIGSGSGFWDSPEKWEHWEDLTNISELFGSCDVYQGDDSFLYIA